MPRASYTQHRADWPERRQSQLSVDSLFDHVPVAERSPADHHQQYQSAEPIAATAGYSHSLEGPLAPSADLREHAPLISRLNLTRKVRRVWNYGWVAESLCCSLAVVSLAAIVVTLRLHEGKPLPQWPYGITINALIAVFGVLMKAGLAVPLSEGIGQLKWQWFEERPRRLIDIDDFDAASRGAWGSFLFLFTRHTYSKAAPPPQTSYDSWETEKIPDGVKNRKGTGYLAKFAAVVTVLAVAVDPFAQQIISYVNCPRVSPDFQSSIARTSGYNATGGHVWAGESDIDSPMAVAINRGLIDPPEHIPSLVSTECKSGNCTFPDFSSVGLCHACEDLTGQIRNITNTTEGVWNFTLPGNDEYPPIYLYRQYVFKTSAIIPPGPHLLDLRLMSMGTGIDPHLSAFHCTIAPCIRTYSAFMTDSTLHEKLLSSVMMGFNLNLAEDQTSYFRRATSRTLRDGREETCVPSEKEGPGLIKVAKENIDAAPQDFGDPAETVWYPEDCVWSFDRGSRYAILSELGKQLGDLDMQRTAGVAVGLIQAKNLWLNGTTSITSVNSYFQKLAEVMTATIRNRGTGGLAEYARGQVLVQDTCVSVQWAWLSYPAALVGLTVIFLLVTFAQSPLESSFRVWKSSALPLLFLSMDEAKYDANYYGMTKNDMNQFAEAVEVQLGQDEEGRVKFS